LPLKKKGFMLHPLPRKSSITIKKTLINFISSTTTIYMILRIVVLLKKNLVVRGNLQQLVRNKMQPKYKEKEIDACHDEFPEIR
jgi:hypothetical protein